MSFGLRDVTVRYGATTALTGVTLEVPPGEVTAVVGGDGAGKSTLLRALVGQVPLVAGTFSAPPAEQLGYLPAAAGSWAELTVQQNVDFVGGAYGLHGSDLARASEPLLQRAGLAPFGDRLASQLSGGMRRKLGFCLAMLHSPRLLVLDEPSTGIDPVSRIDLWQLISEAAASGTAVLFSTTYLDEAERAARILVLDEGNSLLSGPPRQVIGSFAGSFTEAQRPTRPELAWRRGRSFREWWPDDQTPPDVRQVRPDLQDVVVAATLLSRRGRVTA